MGWATQPGFSWMKSWYGRRDTDYGEYAILDTDTSDNGAPKLRYRKRTEEAGQ
jgi:hypothetical protein